MFLEPDPKLSGDANSSDQKRSCLFAGSGNRHATFVPTEDRGVIRLNLDRVQPLDPDTWIEPVTCQIWFYRDATSPHHRRAGRGGARNDGRQQERDQQK